MTPQAPRLKKLMAAPQASSEEALAALPKKKLQIPDISRNSESVYLRPMTSTSQAAA